MPVDLMVELLMLNVRHVDLDDGTGVMVTVSVDPLLVFTAQTASEIRTTIRSYLQSLVPPPKLLSECEEDVATHCEFNPEKFKVLAKREGDYAVGAFGDVIGIASDFQVIQPVEVNRG